jgi:hypothetical protein
MNKRKLLTALSTAGPLLLWVGSALAANSGIGVIDTWSNQFAHVAMAGGYAATGIGLLGILHHVHTGSWAGGLSHVGLAFVGGDLVMNYPTTSPQLGGVGAALIHPAGAILTHPATAHVIHAASRLVS